MHSTRTAPRRPLAMRAIAIAAVSLSLAVAGCSSSDDTVVAVPVSSGAPTTSAPPKILTPMDYVYSGGPETTEFTADHSASGAGDPTSRDDNIWSDIDGCLGAQTGNPSSLAAGPAYVSADQTVQLMSYADIATSEQVAAHEKELKGSGIDACVTKLLSEDDGDGALQNLARRSATSPAGALSRLSYTTTYVEDGLPVPMYVDLVFFGSGRVESQIMVISALKPADELVAAVSAQMVTKIKNQ